MHGKTKQIFLSLLFLRSSRQPRDTVLFVTPFISFLYLFSFSKVHYVKLRVKRLFPSVPSTHVRLNNIHITLISCFRAELPYVYNILMYSLISIIFLFIFVFVYSLSFTLIMELRASQINLRKSSLATGLFSHELSSSPSIGFVTEPYTAFNKIVGKPAEYNVFPELALDTVPRTALYIPRIVQCIGMPQLSNADCQVALLLLEIGTTLIASIYLDINLDPTPTWLSALVTYADSKQYSLLLCIDSNAHSVLFGPTENERGRCLDQFILENNLWVANCGTTPTFQTLSAETFIDVTLTKDIILNNWRVSTEYNASDHNTILFSINQVLAIPSKDIRPWKQADWTKFSASLKAPGFQIPTIISCKKLDKMVSYLYHRIDEALDLACPKITTKVKFKGSRWFSPALARDNKKLRKQYNIAQRFDTTEEWGKYFSMHKKFKYKCRKAKTKTWRHFVTATESEHLMSRLARIAQHKSRAQLHTLKRSDGSFTEPGSDTLDELAKAHFPEASTEIPNESYTSSRLLDTSSSRELYSDFLSTEKVRAALNKFKPLKAPGPDGLKAIAFQHFPDIVISFIHMIYMACIYLHYTPRLWQQASVVFLPKPNKPNYVLGKYFRPIVLSNGLLKGLERIFTWRMDKLHRYYPIHGKQHGFTKGRSTESAISNTVDYIERCLFRRQACIGVFLDISSAYDSISIEHIRDSLYQFGADTDLTEWYYHYLSNRILSLSLHGDTTRIHTAVGFPQGGVASAKFWLLAFDPAIRIINSSFVEGNGYADDCCVIFGGRKPEVIVRRLQRILDKLVTWGRSCGLSFNPDKTVVVNFSRKHFQLVPHLRVDDTYVPFSKEATYLGLTLDHRLTWRKHLDDRITRSKKYLLKINNISKAIWGPKPNLSRWVFRCVVRPMISYASVVWAHSIDTPALEQRLRRLNRLAISTYTLFPRSTPTRGVELLTDTFPLHLWLEKEALCAFVRLAKLLPLNWSGLNRNKRRNVAHRRFWSYKMEEYEIQDLLLETDSCYSICPELQFTIAHDSFHSSHEFFLSLEVASWRIFTDGSKIQNKVGSAFLIYKNSTRFVERKFRLPNTATVFQAELYAIFQAAIFLQSECNNDNVTCQFFSDSMSALMALRATEIISSLVLNTIQALNKLSESGPSIFLYWIRSHSGNVGNEEVDSLAKAATTLSVVSHVPLPRSQVRVQVLEKLRLRWKQLWSDYPEARHSKLFIFESNKKLGKDICNLNRVDLRRLIMAITNHNNLAYHQSLQDDTINPTCRFCRLYDETFDHFFTCSFFQTDRCSLDLTWPFSSDNLWTVEKMIRFINDTDIKQALDRRDLTPIRTSETDEILPDSDSSLESVASLMDVDF